MRYVLYLCILCGLWQFSARAQTDLTRVADSYGPLVVESTIQLLRDACLIKDHLLLERISAFETNDGLARIPGDHGGIWQVDEEMFNLTKAGTPELKKIQDEVFKKLFILWNGINWKDLNRPLYSGLAAAIYLRTKTNDSIPLSKPDQAKFWKTHFRTNGNEQNFLTAMQAMPEGCSIPSQVDLAFVVETSSNVKPIELRQFKDFVNRVINGLTVSSLKVQVAVVTFGSQANVLFHLNAHSNKIDVVSAIDSITQSGGSVATDVALKLTRDDVFNVKNGARIGAAKVTVLLTKSLPDNRKATEQEAILLTDHDVTLFTNVIGPGLSPSDLKNISSQPNCVHHNYLERFDDLENFAVEMDQAICHAPAKVSSGTLTHPCNVDTLLSIPDSPYGTTVQISVAGGSRTVYTSYLYGLPNTAKNDLAFTVDSSKALTLYLHNNSHNYFISLKSVFGLLCMNNYTVDVQVGPPGSVTPDTICIEKGVKKDCSNVTMNSTPATTTTTTTITTTTVSTTQSTLTTPPTSTKLHQTTSNICVGNITTAQHPSDPTKFLMCDIKGQILVVQCPHNETYCAFTNLCEAKCLTTTAKNSQLSTTPIVAPTSLAPSTKTTTPKSPIIIIVLTTGPPIIVATGSGSASSTTTIPAPQPTSSPNTGPSTTKTVASSTTQTVATTTPKTTLTSPAHTPSVHHTTTHSTTNSNCHKNPCTAHALMNNFLYFPACDEHEYYHCSGINMMTTEHCPPDKIFNPNILNCVNEFVFNEDTQVFDKTVPNPCKNAQGDMYFIHPTDKTKFIHCDGYWNGFMRTCPSGEVFNQTTQTCVSFVSSVFGK